MDILDQLQSGLFFHQINTLPPGPNIHQKSLLPQPAPGPIFEPESLNGIPTPPTPHIPDPPARAAPIPLPLLSVSVDVDVKGRLCTTKVTQKFSNASPNVAQNAKYVFPVYDGSVVTSFRCWVGTNLLEGAVKAKETAQAEFKEAVSQYKAAVLVEEMTPEVFETNVGNIPAQTTVKVEISYTNLLKVDNSTGGLVLTIPTSIAPRYGTAPTGYTHNQSLSTDGLKINVNASMPVAIRKMESRSHPISVEMGAVAHSSFETFAAGASSDAFDPTKGRATLSDRTAILHQDFVLFILSGSRELAKSRAIAASQPGTEDLSTVAVTIHPGDLFIQNVNTEDFDGEIIFMVDRSGSMEDKISSLVNVLNVFLRSLPQRCTFNIASFGSSVSWMWPTSQKYSEQNLELASDQVRSFQANFGGTDIYSAIDSVRSHHDTAKDVATNVILLTDGEVWDVDNVIELVRSLASNKESNLRFFSIGIGDRVSHRLVEGIGEQGGGYAEVVPESSAGSWEERVIQMLKAALTPSHLRCEVDFGDNISDKICEQHVSGHTVKRPACLQAPYIIPALTTFSHFSVYYILESALEELPATVNITATTDKGEKLVTQLSLDRVTEQPCIHHLAAKTLMNDYETGHSWLHELNTALKSTSPSALEQVLREEAQKLGQKWSITSKWTSYVAVDSATRQQHKTSIQKAEAVEIRQLTKARPGSFANFQLQGTGLNRLRNRLPPPSPLSELSNLSWNVPSWSVPSGSVHPCSGPSCSVDNQESGYHSRPPNTIQLLGSPPIRTKTRKYSWNPSRVLRSYMSDLLRRTVKEPQQQISPVLCSSSPGIQPESCLNVALPNPRDGQTGYVQEAQAQERQPLSRDILLRTQAADGKFHIDEPSLQESLLQESKADFLDQFLDSIFKGRQSTPGQDNDAERSSIRFNILAILYMTDVHSASKGLWELQVFKAWQWLRQKIADLWTRRGHSGDPPDLPLDRMEHSIMTSQLTSCAAAFNSGRPKDIPKLTARVRRFFHV